MTTKIPEAPVATTKSAPPVAPTKDAAMAPEKNSTDATQGEPLAPRAFKRKAELEKLLAKTPTTASVLRGDIERSLASIATLMTGDVKHMSDTTSHEVNTWLESSKYLAEGTPKPRT